MRIALVIPTYNREPELRRVLENSLKLSPPADEILVIDQTKNHQPLTQNLLNRLTEEGRILYIRQDRPSLNLARNQALLSASADILIFVDDDVTFGTDFIFQYRQLYDDPSVIAASGPVFTDGMQELTQEIPGSIFSGAYSWMDFPMNYAFKTERKLIIGCNFSVRRQEALKAGGFDENFYGSCHGDDHEFSWRLQKMGGKIMYSPLPAVFAHAAPGGCFQSRFWGSYPSANHFYNLFYLYFRIIRGKDLLRAFYSLFRRDVLNRRNLLHFYRFVISGLIFFAAIFMALGSYLRGARLIRKTLD